MKIKYFVFLSLIIISNVAIAQISVLKKADNYFHVYDYGHAIEKYLKVEDKTTHVNRRLAESYKALRDFSNAEIYYQKVVFAKDAKPMDYYNYAYILRINKKYKASTKYMIRFNAKKPEDTRGQRLIQNSKYYEELLVPNEDFTIKNLKMNSSQNDFGVSYFLDDLTFTSDRDNGVLIDRKWNWSHQSFLQVYRAAIVDSTELDSIKRFSGKVESKYHDGPASFTADGNLVVFTRNNLEGRSSDGSINLILLYSERTNGHWEKPKPVPFNSTEYSTGHGTLTDDGKYMYFVSDRPGGFGGTDIYRSKRLKSGSWGRPVNMGPKINTEGNEMFPSIHKNGDMIFFSSDGLLGLGSQDIFVAQIRKEQIVEVRNLGTPINSNNDDFTFAMNKEDNGGYFASDREGGKGGDDIYSFQLATPFNFGIRLKGIARNQYGDIIQGVNVNLYSMDGEKLETILSDDSGKYEFRISRDAKYTLIGSKVKHFAGVNKVNSNTDAQFVESDLVLTTNTTKISGYCLISEKESGRPISGAHLTIRDMKTNTVLDTITSATGAVGWPIKGYRLNDHLVYKVKIAKKGYFAKNMTYNVIIDREGVYRIHEKLDMNLVKVPIGADLSLFANVKPIYFDLGKDNIRPDAAVELDKIVKVLNDNPTMLIELGSHTDSRGTDANNLKLSDRRAKSSAAYIKERITKPERIYGRGYGETKFKKVDKTLHAQYNFLPIGQVLDNAFIDSLPTKEKKEIAHQINRRTEFIILRM